VRLTPDSGTLLIRGRPLWLRCGFEDATLQDDVVILAPAPVQEGSAAGGVGDHRGMAFDRRCRLFHPRPDGAALEYVLWETGSGLGVHDNPARPFPITAAATEVAKQVGSGPGLQRPVALATDGRDYLYVADATASAVWLVDLWQQEFARRLDFASPPVDLASCGDTVFALLADGTSWRLDACIPPQRYDWPAVAGAACLAVAGALDGSLLAWVLVGAGQADAALHPLHPDAAVLPVPYCGDLVAAAEEAEYGFTLTLARRPGEHFRRLRVKGYFSAWLPDLVAPAYDGCGIELGADGQVVYWSALGPRLASPAPVQYLHSGVIQGFALDSGHDQSTWGRLLVEACIPGGTAIGFRAYTSDSLDYPDALTRQPPSGEQLSPIAEAEVTPLLSEMVWQQTLDNPDLAPQEIYRDPSARPLTPLPPEGFARFDAPLAVAPGRYLWLVFELTGSRSKTPRLLSARAEYPGHDLLNKLPRTLWNQPSSRDFLFRYLMPIAAMLDEWQEVASGRQRLLDPSVAPASALPWLAGFVGLALDPCWSETVRRTLIAEAASLFRSRGTVGSLTRMLEILTGGAKVVLIELFRLRGGGVVGNPAAASQQAVLGAGFRVGGTIGAATTGGHEGAPQPGDIADFDSFAHRFSVTLVAALDEAQLDCARRLIEMHKPAHTAFDLCTAQAGIRVGIGAHVGVSTVIGESAGFSQAILGDAALGAGFLLGRPELDSATAGGDS
jgi:phage tail-like protein